MLLFHILISGFPPLLPFQNFIMSEFKKKFRIVKFSPIFQFQVVINTKGVNQKRTSPEEVKIGPVVELQIGDKEEVLIFKFSVNSWVDLNL